MCMNSDPLTLMVEDCELPSDEQERERVLNELESVLANTLPDYDESEETLRIFDGDFYAQTNMHVNCPDCRERLTLEEFRLGPENGAAALAYCSCGWSGRAVYRLIDLHKDVDNDDDRDPIDPYSCVSEDNMLVTYTPYQDTDSEWR